MFMIINIILQLLPNSELVGWSSSLVTDGFDNFLAWETSQNHMNTSLAKLVDQVI